MIIEKSDRNAALRAHLPPPIPPYVDPPVPPIGDPVESPLGDPPDDPVAPPIQPELPDAPPIPS